MEQQDLEMEQRVWERVSGGQSGPDLRGMELQCRESAAAFRQLAEQTKGAARETLMELHRKEQEHAEILRGMRIQAGEEPEPRRSYGAGQVTLARGLAQALRRSREAWDGYSAHSRMGSYGPVFAAMCQTEAQIMEAILGLIGKTRG